MCGRQRRQRALQKTMIGPCKQGFFMKLQKRSHRRLAWLLPIAVAFYSLPRHPFPLFLLTAGLIDVLFQELTGLLAQRSVQREESAEPR